MYDRCELVQSKQRKNRTLYELGDSSHFVGMRVKYITLIYGFE